MKNDTQHEASRALILEKGIEIKVPTRSLFSKLTGKKERIFLIKQSYLGTLYHLSKLYTSVDINENEITGKNWLSEGKRIYKNSPILCRIVAVSYLNSRLKIAFFSRLLAFYLRWHLTPDKLDNIVKIIILDVNNMKDFINTTRLSSVSPMTMTKKDLGPADNGG